MTSLQLEQLIQYGFAGVALLMLYNIAFNHLTVIQTTLTEVKIVLEDIRDGIDLLIQANSD